MNNSLLADLTDTERALLKLEAVELARGSCLHTEGADYDFIYFIESGFASAFFIGQLERQIELALIGSEGFTGYGAVLGNRYSPHLVVMQVAGRARRTTLRRFQQVLTDSQRAKLRMLQYVYRLLVQKGETSFASSNATLIERLARWLLMASDRSTTNLAITHEAIAEALSVRRSGVTQALQRLAASGLICGSRNRIDIIDRNGLVSLCSNFYSAPRLQA